MYQNVTFHVGQICVQVTQIQIEYIVHTQTCTQL